MASAGPFAPKSPGLPSTQWQNGPAQMRMTPRTPSPQEDQRRNESAQKSSSERRGPRLTVVNKFLEEMDQPPKFLKPEDPYTFSTATPHLSSGPGPAFTEEGPVSPFDFGFRPEPPPKNDPQTLRKGEPKQPAHTHKRSGSRSRFNQFPPPKNMKKLNMSPPQQRRPSTPSNNSLSVANNTSPSNSNRSPKSQQKSQYQPSNLNTFNSTARDPAVQAGLDPSLRRSNSNPLDETNTSDSQNNTDLSKSSTSHRSFPPGSGPPKHICRGCTLPITGPSLKDSSGRLTGRYHKSCFTCTACAAPFPSGDFYVLKNEPFCAQHYHERNGSTCTKCRMGIEGPYAETDNKKLFHRECFRCAECSAVFEGPEYWEMSGRLVCGKHVNAATMAGRGEKRRTRFGMMGGMGGMSGMGAGMGQGGGMSRDRLAPPDPRQRWM
jgi:LIM domain